MERNKKLKEYIKENVKVHIDSIFVDVHTEFDTKHGDISPYQQFKLDKLQKDLVTLIYKQVNQNL